MSLDARDTTRMRDLQGSVTMVVWPKAPPGSDDLTPSPLMDALSSTTTDLVEARTRLSADTLIKDDTRSKKPDKSIPG